MKKIFITLTGEPKFVKQSIFNSCFFLEATLLTHSEERRVDEIAERKKRHYNIVRRNQTHLNKRGQKDLVS